MTVDSDSRVEAVGGGRFVPSPDEVAREYILLALRLDQHIAGLVDAYHGPASLKAQVDMEQLRAPARLMEDAARLREAIEGKVDEGGAGEADAGGDGKSGGGGPGEADRRSWLLAQVAALTTHAAALAGTELPYEEHVERCFAWRPRRRDEAPFATAVAGLGALLPGDAPLADRLAAWDEQTIVPLERLPAVVEWLVAGFRGVAARLFGLPDGEDVRVSLVRSQPWSGYNWYDGGLRSRVDINTDLPVTAANLVHTLAHETYPGHHLEHAWKEAELVGRRRRAEASIQLINTPECLVSEGLADLGVEFAAPPDERVDLLVELFERAGLSIATDRAAARDRAERQVEISRARRALEAAGVNAILMRHVDGASAEATTAYLRDVGGLSPERAAKRLEFIDHPLWRTYGFVYSEGEALLRRWLDAGPADQRAARFGRLLREQLDPASIAAEIGAGA